MTSIDIYPAELRLSWFGRMLCGDAVCLADMARAEGFRVSVNYFAGGLEIRW